MEFLRSMDLGFWLVLDGLNWIYDGIHWKLRIPSLV